MFVDHFAWAITSRWVTVFFVGPSFLEIELGRLADNPELRLTVDERTREQLVQALLGLTETEVENALAKAAITYRGIGPEAIPLILDEKRNVIHQSGSLTYSHPEPVDHLGGYANLRKLLHKAAVTFTPAARSYGVEPTKGILLFGLPGTGKDFTKRIASSILGRPLLDLDFGAVMGEGGGVIGSAAMSIKRALAIATTLKGILGISEFEKGVGGLHSSAKSDAGETARTIAHLLNWMQEQRRCSWSQPRTTCASSRQSRCARGDSPRWSSLTCLRGRIERPSFASTSPSAVAIPRRSTSSNWPRSRKDSREPRSRKR
jgi:hypothetical protein